MPRPTKCRRVCGLPDHTAFGPMGADSAQAVTMTVDEYETIRLIDLEGLTQEECAAQMGIARATVAGIWTRARRKSADALVNGKQLTVSGGNYALCRHSEPACCGRRAACGGRIDQTPTSKGEQNMKIAATYENGQIFQHFGHTEQFKIYTVENDRIISMEVVDTDGSGHGALASFLQQQGVGILICGGIGGGARMALMDAGIAVFAGASGEADLQVGALLAGMLAPNPDVTCDHHDHAHGEGHSCGTCGSHGSCGGHC